MGLVVQDLGMVARQWTMEARIRRAQGSGVPGDLHIGRQRQRSVRFLALYRVLRFRRGARPPGRTGSFQARAQGLIEPVYGDLVVFQSDPVWGGRSQRQIRKSGGDRFTLGMVLSGSRYHRDEKDEPVISGPGDFFCYDAAKPSRVRWTAHRGVHLSLPRRLVEEATNGRIPPAASGATALAASPLAPFVRSQLRLIANHLGSLSRAERATVFRQTVELVLAALGQAYTDQEAGRSAYFVAAKRYIDADLADAELDPAQIAAGVGCSRATLYRAFAQHGLTVAGYVREVRLREAMHRLRAAPADTPIHAVAVQCGFNNLSNFRSAFRDRFGMSPREVRDSFNE